MSGTSPYACAENFTLHDIKFLVSVSPNLPSLKCLIYLVVLLVPAQSKCMLYIDQAAEYDVNVL